MHNNNSTDNNIIYSNSNNHNHNRNNNNNNNNRNNNNTEVSYVPAQKLFINLLFKMETLAASKIATAPPNP